MKKLIFHFIICLRIIFIRGSRKFFHRGSKFDNLFFLLLFLYIVDERDDPHKIK